MTLEVVAKCAEDKPSRRAAVNSELRHLERRNCEHHVTYRCRVGVQQVEARICASRTGRVEGGEFFDRLLLVIAESLRRDEYIADILFEERLVKGLPRLIEHEEDEAGVINVICD